MGDSYEICAYLMKNTTKGLMQSCNFVEIRDLDLDNVKLPERQFNFTFDSVHCQKSKPLITKSQ